MYPTTIFNWYDQSEIQVDTPAVDATDRPLFMVVSSFDKGPEDFMTVTGDTFNELYGTMSFTRHGQNSIQAQRIIDAGGSLFVKRICASDATLANTVFVATLKTTEAQATDENGKPLYLNESGSQTTDVTENPLMKKSVSIKWEAKSIENCKTFDDVKKAAHNLLDDSNGVYPVMIFADNGRGESGKAVRIVPDYNTSRSMKAMFYSLMVYEGTASTETDPITFNPDTIYNNVAYGLDQNSCVQVIGETDIDVYNLMVAKIASELEKSVDEIKAQDIIFGYTTKGAVYDGLSVDDESVDMNASYGVELKNGSNGAFGNTPVNTEDWATGIADVFNGKVSDCVYDVDEHKLFAVCDANFPKKVKDAIAEFVNFRKDCMFFRDFGVNVPTFADIHNQYEDNQIKSRFIANYGTCYEVVDPETQRNIRVSMMYDYAAVLVNHYLSGPCNPVAGVANNAILTEAIKGTVNFIPYVTPTNNQKQAIEDIKVNYAIFEGDNCVVQSEYTSQDAYTQLSYVNNVLSIQYVARAVRTVCPKNRYTLITNNDLSAYTKDVNNVLSNFTSNFDTLELVYTADPLKIAQKIYYAGINFRFADFIQTEIFDLFALANE
mgnify:FL=1